MLWEESQKRVAREERGRMSELFVTVSDAMVAAMGRTGQLQRRPELPEYVAPRKALTLADLAAAFPDHVGAVTTEFN